MWCQCIFAFYTLTLVPLIPPYTLTLNYPYALTLNYPYTLTLIPLSLITLTLN